MAFIWDQSHGMRRLSDVLTQDYGLDLSGWQLDSAWGISDDGKTIVGQGTGAQGVEAWVAHLDQAPDLAATPVAWNTAQGGRTSATR